jgi:hypothetical protein
MKESWREGAPEPGFDNVSGATPGTGAGLC